MGMTWAQKETGWEGTAVTLEDHSGQRALQVMACLAQSPRMLPCGRTPLVLALQLTRSKALSIQDGKRTQLDLWAPFPCQQPEILIMKKEGKQVRQITHVSFSWPLNWKPPTLQQVYTPTFIYRSELETQNYIAACIRKNTACCD